jgi:heme/copper-type cytochrome/quinol oxidase subunit 3
MSHASSLDHHQEDRNDPQFGKASIGKLAMWIFLVTDAMSFSGFLLAYGILRATMDWPHPAQYLGINLSGFATFILVCSSLSMVLAIDCCKSKDRQGMLNWLLATIGGGVFFLT